MRSLVSNLEEIQTRGCTKEIEEDTLDILLPGHVVLDNKLLLHAASIYIHYVYKFFELQFILSNDVGETLDVGEGNLEITSYATCSYRL